MRFEFAFSIFHMVQQHEAVRILWKKLRIENN